MTIEKMNADVLTINQLIDLQKDNIRKWQNFDWVPNAGSFIERGENQLIVLDKLRNFINLLIVEVKKNA